MGTFWFAMRPIRVSSRRGDVLVASAVKFSSPLSAFIFFHAHGAGARVPASAKAFAARRPPWDFDTIGQGTDASESAAHISSVRDLRGPHLQGSVYVNHIAADDRPEKLRPSFGGNYQRLRALKAQSHPTNLFRINANIPPA